MQNNQYSRIPSCKYLQLKPTPRDTEKIQKYLDELKEKVSDRNLLNLVSFLLGTNFGEKTYIPYCQKEESICTVLESPVISMRYSGDMYQPLELTLMNAQSRIEGCKDREFPSASPDGKESLSMFLLRRVLSNFKQNKHSN